MPKPTLGHRPGAFDRPRTFDGSHRTGVTLVEMLVSVALTLLVVLAIVRIFDMLGTTVTDSRSILELSAQLRNVSSQLQKDLDRLTVTTVPPVDPDSGAGFLEIIEGPDTDWDPQWGIRHDEEANFGRSVRSLDPSTPNLIANAPDDPNAINGQRVGHPMLSNHFADASGRYGDLDDLLIFTIRSDEEPFVGRISNLTLIDHLGSSIIRSKYALVIWWVERSYTTAGVPASFQLHRRQLLIRPDLTQLLQTVAVNAADVQLPEIRNTSFHSPSFDKNVDVNRLLNQFLNGNDIAIHFPPGQPGIQASSLSNLANRRNRIAHVQPDYIPIGGVPPQFEPPFEFANHPADTRVELFKRDDIVNEPWQSRTVYPLGLVSKQINHASFSGMDAATKRAILSNFDRSGEDLVLSDLLAFDVKVFDPSAPLMPQTSGSDTFVVAPHDLGYAYPANLNALKSLFDSSTIRMRGAFVDLFYMRHAPALSNWTYPSISTLSHFSGPPLRMGFSLVAYSAQEPPLPNAPLDPDSQQYHAQNAVTYDTWSARFERDGFDQDGDGLIDEGTDGLDNDNNGIVDDLSEQESPPPYRSPLRGIEVTIRAVEISSQQIRQTSVVADFKDE